MSTVMTRRALQLAGLLGLGLLTACLAPVPPELIDARLAFDRAQASQTSTYAPEELARARRALNRAESEYQRAPRGRNARDLAYVAHRKVQIADSHARLEIAQQELARARQQLSDRQAMTASQLAEARARLQAQQDEQQRQQAAEMDRAQREAAERATREQAAQVEQLARAKEQLDESQRKMDAQQQQLQLRQQELDQARRDREQAEAARKEALAELERVAKVSEEQRGTVITLPGGLLFAPGQTVLSGDAQRALGQVAEALKAVPDQRVVIEGHTDSKGTEDANYELSILRANAVKDFLSSRGVERERVETVGYGESRPVASNTTAEGRATNRRVEIVVQRGVGGSGPGLLRKP